MAKLTFGGDVKRTMCVLCPVRCGMLVEVQDGHPVRFDGDPHNPSANGFLCIKGTTVLEMHEHPDRLNHPMKRVGARGEGRWEPIGWEQALDEIAEKLAEIRETDGPEALATLGGTSHTFEWANWRFAAQFGTPNFINQGRNCGAGELLTETSVYGWDTIVQGPVPGVTKCLVLWGSNPAESVPPAWRSLNQAVRDGMKVIVIDPRRTRTAELADLHLQLRPRTDGALGLAMIRVIIEEGLYDHEFVETWCTGFDEVRRIAAEWTPERAAEVTGVPAELIVEAARMYGSLSPARLNFGVATAQIGEGASRSALLCKAILRAITGNLDVLGGDAIGNVHDPSLLAYLENIGFEGLIDHPLRTRDNVNAADSPISSVEGYRAFLEAQRPIHPAGHSGAQYMLFTSPPHVYRAILERDPYPVRAAIVQSGEPLMNYGGSALAHEAFTSPNLELLVVMDLWRTPTAQLADYVLPAAGFLERPDVAMSWGLGSDFAVAQQVVEPQHERRNDYDLWAGLGRRLLDPDDWPATIDEMLDRFLAPSGRTHREWAEGEQNWSPRPEYADPHAWRKHERHGFATPSGKVELLPSIFERFGINALPTYEGPPYARPDVDDEAAYPLQMLTGSRVREFMGSTLRQSTRLRKIHPEPLVNIHPDTAAGHGIADGDWVAIERPEGTIRQKARLTDAVRRDTIDPAGYWWEPGSDAYLSGFWDANTNAITPSDPALSSFAGDQPLRGMRCRIRRAQDQPEAVAVAG